MGCRDSKILKRSRKWLNILREQVAVRMSGQHTASIWFFVFSQLRGDERLYPVFRFYCPNETDTYGIVVPSNLILY